MSLPRSLPTELDSHSTYGSCGPFYVNSAVYFPGFTSPATNKHLDMFKSSDPDTTAFTAQDISNNPVISTTAAFGSLSLDSYVDGDIIHIVVTLTHTWPEPNDDVITYWRYDTSTDTWSTSHGAWGTVLSAYSTDGPPIRYGSAIRVHTVSSTENIEITYSAGQLKNKGTPYQRVHRATYAGSSWSIGNRWDYSDQEGARDYAPAGLAEYNDIVYGLVQDSPLYDIMRLYTRNASGIQGDNVDSLSDLKESWGGTGFAYDDGGTTRLAHLPYARVLTDTTLWYKFSAVAAPTDLVVSVDADKIGIGYSSAVALCLDGSDVYTLYVDDAGRDLWYDKNGGTDVQELVDTLTDYLSTGGTSYTVGGRKVIGYLYSGSSGRSYGEISLTAPAAVYPPFPRRKLTTVRM